MTIYEVISDCTALNSLLQGETDPETGELRELSAEEVNQFKAWIDETGNNLETKMNNIYKAVSNKRAEAEIAEAERKALKDEIDRLSKRAQAKENEANRIKALFAFALERLGMKKFKTALFSVGWQNTKKCARPADGVFNPDNIPVEYLKRELSSVAINQAIEEGRLYEKDNPAYRGTLFYIDENATEQVLKGVNYLGGETLVIR